MLELTRAQGLAGALTLFAVAVLCLSAWASLRAVRSPGATVLGAWRLGLSQAVGAYSFWILLGVSALAYTQGFAASWLAVGVAIGAAMHWFFIGPRLRAAEPDSEPGATAAPGSVHPPAWLDGPGAAAIVMVILLIALIAQLRVAGVVLAHGLGVAISVGVAIAGALATLPALIGARRAAVDVAVVCAALLIPLAALLTLPALAFAAAVGEVFQAPELSMAAGTSGGIMKAVGGLAIGLALAGQPQLLDQFGVARDARTVRRAGWVAIAWYGVLLGAMLLFGWAARLLYSSLQVADVALIDATARIAPPALQGLPALAICIAVTAAASYQILLVVALALRRPVSDAPVEGHVLATLGAAVIVTGIAATIDFGSSRVYVFAVVTLAAVVAPVLIARLAGAQWRPATVAVVTRAGLVLALVLFLVSCA